MTAATIRLTILLEGTEPQIWRRVDVSADTTLNDLHEVIQTVMGWDNAHLYEFELVGGVMQGPGLGTGSTAAGTTRLADLMRQDIDQFRYVYDMGDDWGHTLQVEPAPISDSKTSNPRFIDGAGRCPPEDVGGPPGFYEFLKAMRNTRHPQHRELKEWYGGAFDPKAMDAATIRRRLKELAPRPTPAPRRATKKKSNPSKTF